MANKNKISEVSEATKQYLASTTSLTCTWAREGATILIFGLLLTFDMLLVLALACFVLLLLLLRL